jgi:AcrR family transcriptional regulator
VPGKRERLIEAAAALLVDEGPGAVSVRRVASDVGVSTMAVYTWFGSKEELLEAVRAEGFARFGASLAAVGETSDPLHDLLGLGSAYRRFAHEFPHLYHAMFGRTLAGIEPTPEHAAQARATFDIMRDAVARAVELGVWTCDVDSAAGQLWAAVHGFVMLELADVMLDPDHDAAYAGFG